VTSHTRLNPDVGVLILNMIVSLISKIFNKKMILNTFERYFAR